MSDQKPFRQGVQQGPQAAKEAAPAAGLSPSANETLVDLSERFTIFTPMLIENLVPTLPDLFTSYLEEQNKDCTRYVLQFDRQIFAGHGGHILHMLTKEDWEGYSQYLGTVAVSVHDAMLRVRFQQLSIPDILASSLSASSVEPVVPVTALVAETTKGCVYFYRNWLNGKLHSIVPKFDKEMKWSDLEMFHAAFNKGLDDPYGEAAKEQPSEGQS